MQVDPHTADDFLSHLSRARRVLLTTHARPDGDALGSVAAMALALRSKGVETSQLLLTHMPTKYRFIFEESGLDHFDAGHSETGTVTGRGSRGGIPDFSDFDTLLITDTGTFSQLPGIEARIEAFKGTILVLDHHKTQEPWGTARLVDTTVSSAAELVCRTMRQWFGPGGGLLSPKDPRFAEAVYVGIVSDTGWFQFSNTGPATLRLAADLMDAGVDPDRMYRRLFQSEREPRLRLQIRAMESMRLLAGGKLAVLSLTKADFEQTTAGVPDTENLINFPLQLASVEMSLLAVEPPEGGPVRISCRSKGKVDVSKFAEKFGGGGHARASGLKISDTMPSALAKVVAEAEATLG